MDPAFQQVMSADGTTIPFWRSGRGRPLLLVSGRGGDHSRWHAVRPYLEPSATVVTMDRRCGLASYGDPSTRYPLEREFEDIVAVVTTFAEPVDLLGWSSGGICALGAALQLPNLRRLLLYEPPWLGDWFPPLCRKFEHLLAAGDLEGIEETMFSEGLRLPGQLAARKAAPDWPATVQRARFTPREMAALAGWHFDPECYRTFTHPVCLLVGGDTPPEHHHRGFIAPLSAVLPDFRVVELPDQLHFAPIAAPAAFAQHVLDFVNTADV